MIFHVILEEAEDGWIVAECPALAGCVSQGRDEKELHDKLKAQSARVDTSKPLKPKNTRLLI